ncbi:MAG: TonB-dependent receptor [Rikenellaceae bacterium]|nr:TonB-dependent receptor [Rikenellaceae bacterium]
MRQIFILFILLIFNPFGVYAEESRGYSIRGEVIDKITREPLPAVVVEIESTKYITTTDANGKFIFPDVPGGMYMLKADMLGYKSCLSYEFMLTVKGVEITLELEEDNLQLNEITVKPKADPFKRVKESPLSQKSISIQEIERNPGANRDISKVLNSFPGVATVNGDSERNDIIVRGGAPSENRFYLDGVEIPTINHFSTQGSTGGVVGIIDAGLIRDADFYSGAFPVNKGNSLSSILDIRYKEGDLTKNSYKFTIGAYEAGLNATGSFSDKTTFIMSARVSYLQFLFKALNLPLLPTFTDMQFKVKHRFDRRHEISIIGLGALDNMSLNEDTGGKERNEYILAYLPVIKQNVYTMGAVYRYYDNNGYWNFVLSNSYLRNKNTKYLDNDDKNPDKLTLAYTSVENEVKFRAEKIANISNFRITAGVGLEFPKYENDTYQKIFIGVPVTIKYQTTLSFTKYNLFASGNYITPDEKLSLTLGFRSDANSYSNSMKNPLGTFSPRLAISYEVLKNISLNSSVGRYYQLPPFTALGYTDNSGSHINKEVDYIGVDHYIAGVEYKMASLLQITFEVFYKRYSNMLRSVNDNIPLMGKSTVYGASGNEQVASDIKGKSYGAELSVRVFAGDKFNLSGTGTLYRSLYQQGETKKWIPQSWDNKVILSFAAGYKLPYNFYAGIKYRYAGGSPYTPYDVERSSLVQAWNASGRAYYDYTRYNQERLPPFSQLDVRLDKDIYRDRIAFKFYIDIQNVLNRQNVNPDILLSTGNIANPDAPLNEQRYVMKSIDNTTGTILPTIGISVEF